MPKRTTKDFARVIRGKLAGDSALSQAVEEERSAAEAIQLTSALIRATERTCLKNASVRSEKEVERALVPVLAMMLGRKPTEDEVGDVLNP